MNFTELNLKPEINKALEDKGYITPTPIQQKAILPILAGKDLLGCAQTGTGKTAAFALPILNNIQPNKKVQVLVLTPTRELAIQIKDNFTEYSKYLKVKNCVIFGGVKQHSQVLQIKNGVDIVIATPGRLLDLISQKLLSLRDVKYLVLDEADNMLDMGFIHDIKKIIKLIPEERQTLLFSATMPADIKKLADAILNEPVEISVAPVSSTVDTVQQSVYFVDKVNKPNLLVDYLQDKGFTSTLVFTRTKHGADKLVRFLNKHKFKAAAIHGNKSQNNRERTLKDFKDGNIEILIATDIAARGLDISDLAYVINYDIPNISETYVHRIGRTGRAGQSGISTSFCDFEEKAYLKDIEKLINKKIEVIDDHAYPLVNTTIEKKAPQRGGSQRPGNSGNFRNNNPRNSKNTGSKNTSFNKSKGMTTRRSSK